MLFGDHKTRKRNRSQFSNSYGIQLSELFRAQLFLQAWRIFYGLFPSELGLPFRVKG